MKSLLRKRIEKFVNMLSRNLNILSLCFCCNSLGKPFPISFSISETKIVREIPHKDKDFSSLIPGNLSTYIYTNEEDYYREYQRSFYALTWKKGGWDCLRHYEILANGCIPYFVNIENCPPNTMHLFPKELILEAMHLPGVYYGRIDHAKFDQAKYYEILNKLLTYTRKYLTTKSIAQYFLDVIGYSGQGNILFLSSHTKPDYLVACILTGLKQIAPEKIIDFPKLDYIYINYPLDPKSLYGKGFSYSKVIEDVPVDRSNIENRIKNKEFEFIIYAHVHQGCIFHDLIKKNYPKEKIVYIDGEDEHAHCKYAGLTNFFLREYSPYVIGA